MKRIRTYLATWWSVLRIITSSWGWFLPRPGRRQPGASDAGLKVHRASWPHEDLEGVCEEIQAAQAAHTYVGLIVDQTALSTGRPGWVAHCSCGLAFLAASAPAAGNLQRVHASVELRGTPVTTVACEDNGRIAR